jgi:uncharacterized protein (DUF58 family)
VSLRQNAFVLLALAALIGIAGDWSLDPTVARLWRVPVAVLLLGIGYEALVIARARVRLVIRARTVWPLARADTLSFELAHALPRTLSVEIAPEPPAGFVCPRAIRALALGPAPGSIALEGTAQRLGKLVWPSQRARIAGPLGLAWWPRRLDPDCGMRVVPDVLGAAAAAAPILRAGERATVFGGTGGEILQLREYRPGDALKRIDWKASARRGLLIARDYSEDQHLDIVIALDAGRGSGIWCGELDRLGHYLNLAARFAERALAQDDRVGLVVYAERALAALPPQRGNAALSSLRGLLGAVTIQGAESNPLCATARIRSLVRHRCLVLLLTDLGDTAAGSPLAQAVRGLRPEHLPFVVALRSAALAGFAEAASGDWLDPYRTLAAQEYRLHERRRIAALAALGVPALVAPPERLEQEVYAAYGAFRRAHRI